jgi:putative phosphoesterase
MRIALLADIHGNLAALEAVEKDFSMRGVDAVVNLGDSLSGPLLPRETADYLMARDWIQVAGNHERQLLSVSPESLGASDTYTLSQLTAPQRAWLASLVSTRIFWEDVLLCHGTPASDHEHLLATVEARGLRMADQEEVERRLVGAAATLIACGHAHIPWHVRSRSGQLIVNPGSVGLQAYVDTDPCPFAHASCPGVVS